MGGMGGVAGLVRFHPLVSSGRAVSFTGPERLDGQAKLDWKNSWCRLNRAGKETLPNAPTKLVKGPSLYLKIKDPSHDRLGISSAMSSSSIDSSAPPC